MPLESDPTPAAYSDGPGNAEPERTDAEVEESARKGRLQKLVHGRYARYAYWLDVSVRFLRIRLDGTHPARATWAVLATLVVLLGAGLLVALPFNGAGDPVNPGGFPEPGDVAPKVCPKDPRDYFRECAECPEMVVVPAGSYRMGSLSHEEGRNDDEGSTHTVTIGVCFAVGRYEVTFAQWDACVSDGGCPQGGDIADDEEWGRDEYPVINVSWHDAQRYVQWLSGKTSEPYRLLSESEWEYAAYAGTETAYSWGDRIGDGRANCDGCGSQWDDRQTAPVRSFAANAWGLHDMHGNVAEWVEDCWNDSYAGSPRDGSAWRDGDCSRHVLRGGSWSSDLSLLRAAAREVSNVRYDDVGFRVARTLTPSATAQEHCPASANGSVGS